MSKINKLPQEIINQIAAGEVVERPASVVKELVDNSIDAEADQIKISLKDGGKKVIEITDNGIGIGKDDLELAFQPHTTSKLSSIEDLNTLMSMGFRGEALSTIQSVAKIEVKSKTENQTNAYKLLINPEEQNDDLQKTAHPQGTTIKVKDLFFNIPARLKYLKKANTEYRHIYETLLSYFLIHPEIHFEFYKDGKKIHALPKIKDAHANTIHPRRVKQVISSGWTDELIDFYYQGTTLKIGGLVAHPKNHFNRTQYEHIFVNNRPIYDRGVVRSVLTGFSRFIPHGQKVPFLISIKLDPSLVDVNIHPRKEEVKFANPYRVYQAIEQAIQKALQRETAKNKKIFSKVEDRIKKQDLGQKLGEKRLRNTSKYGESRQDSSGEIGSKGVNYRKTKSGKIREISFNKHSVKDSLEFSKNLLQMKDNPEDIGIKQDGGLDLDKVVKLVQIFNKYIMVEFKEELWVVDQHAMAERITYEKFLKSLETEKNNSQGLLDVPIIKLVDWQINFIEENLSFFESIGFDLEIDERSLKVKAVPIELGKADFEALFETLFSENSEIEEMEFDFEQKKKDLIASLACHNSVRSGKSLSDIEMRGMLKELANCKNSYSCPHGRPIIWELALSDIDSHFERTY